MMIRLFLTFLMGAWWIAISALASDKEPQTNGAFPIPEYYKLINDYAGVLLMSEAMEINKKLQALEKRNGTQIVFLSVPHVGDAGVQTYAHKVFEKWDIGNNGQGNGVLFLVSAEGSYIMTGPGIAGALPDVKIRRIFREIIEPHWQHEKYSEGVKAGINVMIEAAQGEDTAPTYYDYLHPVVPTKSKHILIVILVLVGIGYAAVLFWHRRNKRKQNVF